MVRRPPSRSSVLIAITLLVAFAVWTWLTFNSPALAAFDARTLPPPVDPTSRTAEIISAFALLTWPGFEYAALAGIALWAIRHRLRQLAAHEVGHTLGLLHNYTASTVGRASWSVR